MRYRRTTHAIYELNYHLVWPVKYRQQIEPLEIRKFFERLFQKIVSAYGFEVMEQNV